MCCPENDKYILVDTGSPINPHILLLNIAELGVPCRDIAAALLTHCHIRHAGGAYFFYKLGADIIIHYPDDEPLRHGDPELTRAAELNLVLTPTPTSTVVRSNEEAVNIHGLELVLVWSPGHTPGSMYIIAPDKRIIFLGDLASPLSKAWRSDEKSWRKSIAKCIDHMHEYNIAYACLGHAVIKGDQAIQLLNELIEKGPIWVSHTT